MKEKNTSEVVKTIKPGQTLTARSIGDHDCIFSVEILARNKSFVTVNAMGNVKRCKVHVYEGAELIYAFGRYSMAPTFRAQ